MSGDLLRETHASLKPFLGRVALATLLGIAGGLGITALLATINEALNADAGPDYQQIALFAGLCLLILVCSTLSKLIMNYVGQQVVLELRQRLAKQVLLAPIEQLERFRSHRLIPVLVQDVTTISQFSLNIAPLIVSSAITIGCLSYLAWLSWQVLLATLATVVVGSSAQFFAYRLGRKYLNTARDGEDELQKHYQALISGAKELRIQRLRRLWIYSQQIQGTTERISKANISSANIFISAETFGSILFFVVIGLAIVFQLLWPSVDRTMLGGFVLVLLYMKGPLEQIVNILPGISRAQISAQRIASLSHQFLSPEPNLLAPEPETAEASQGSAVNDRSPPFQSLWLRDVEYGFAPVDGAAAFQLGPIDLEIRSGEILFIVGENGCGKTTIIKLLLGLYPPQNGYISLDGNPVTSDSLDDYRQLFTTVFSDYHLFDELMLGREQLPHQAQNYLHRLDIAHKVSISNGVFTTTDLSTGQRKRLALVNAWLEDRAILVFDEWAADQDPAFRRIFYTELLPELKQRSKTVIAISHDDRYFNVADRVIRLDAGCVAEHPSHTKAASI